MYWTGILKAPFLMGLVCVVVHVLETAAIASATVTEVKLRTEDRDQLLTVNELKIMGVLPNYTLHRPRPFIYLTDANHQKRVRGFENRPFVVGGLNCDQWLNHVASITGIPMESLTERGRPGNQAPDSDPAWTGINNKNIRSSFDGFLKAGQSIKEVLLKDNETVRNAGLTHQSVIAPVLTAMEQMNEMVLQGKDWNPEIGFQFDYRGEKYAVLDGTLGLVYFAGLKYDEDMKKVQDADMPKVRALARHKAKSYRTGWTGSGVQGSIFNDEIYSSCNLTFIRSDGKNHTIDCLTPHLINRYGFYQGGPYRQPAEALIKFFKLKPNADDSQNWKATCGE